MSKFNRVYHVATATAFMALVSVNAQAEGLADLAAGIDKTDILAGFTAVALLIGAVLGARKGIRMILSLIK